MAGYFGYLLRVDLRDEEADAVTVGSKQACAHMLSGNFKEGVQPLEN